MPDNSLTFETRVNLGGLESGLNNAKAKVEQFSDNMKSAMASSKDAVNQLADAQLKLGASAAAGSTCSKLSKTRSTCRDLRNSFTISSTESAPVSCSPNTCATAEATR